jgi:hypothetical protein
MNINTQQSSFMPSPSPPHLLRPFSSSLPPPAVTTQQPSLRKNKQRIPAAVRAQVWCLYIGRDIAHLPCPLCGLNEISMLGFECAHVVAECHGGPTTVDNLRPICKMCNASMATDDMRTFIQTYRMQQTIFPGLVPPPPTTYAQDGARSNCAASVPNDGDSSSTPVSSSSSLSQLSSPPPLHLPSSSSSCSSSSSSWRKKRRSVSRGGNLNRRHHTRRQRTLIRRLPRRYRLF